MPRPYASHRPRRPAGRARGFTLIELMITIAIAGILVALAAPSMTRVIKGNRVQTEASSFVSDLMYARTEAVRRGQPVNLCPSSNGTSCLSASTNTWHSGWIVYWTPPSGTAIEVLRKRAALRGGDTFASTLGSQLVTFNREGFATGLGTTNATFKLKTSDGDTKLMRCVAVTIVGRVTTQTYNQTGSSCT